MGLFCFASLTPYTYVNEAVNAVNSNTRPELQNDLCAGALVNVLAARKRYEFRALDTGAGSSRAIVFAEFITTQRTRPESYADKNEVIV
jgi:hypothetical protein